MVPARVLSSLLILTVGLAACASPAPASDSPTPARAQETFPALTDISPAAAEFTADMLKNAQYQLGARDDHAVVQLSDGKYQQGTDATTLDFAYIALTDFIALGDLNGDGVNEAAALFLENYGGTGNFAILAIYSSVDGAPAFLTSTFIDDRPLINGIAIENGEVFLDAIVHDFDDGGCCPEFPTTRRYALVNNQLRLVNFSSTTPTGEQRIVKIESPADGTEVSGTVQVSGSVSISPFENTLSYSISDESGNQYAAGPMLVNAPDLGAPGTFNETFTLGNIPAGTVIYLELHDQSAADGSILAMDAVKLIIK